MAYWPLDMAKLIELEQERTLVRFDRSEVKKATSIIATYNPKRYLARRLESSKSPEGELLTTRGYESTRNNRYFLSPFELLSNSLNDLAVESLENGNATIIDRHEWEGHPVVVLQTDPMFIRNHTYRQHFWVDVERACIVRRQSYGRIAEGPWGLHVQRDYKGHYQDADSKVWLPTSSAHWNYAATETGQGHLVAREIYLFHNWQVNPEIPAERFELEFPEGTPLF